MPQSLDFRTLLPALRAAQSLLKALPFPGVLVGGIAVSLQAEARATQDIDAIIHDELLQIERVVNVAKSFGLSPASEQAIENARKRRILALVHEPTGVRVDVLFGLFPFEERAAKSGQSIEKDGETFSVCRTEDLLVLKSFAGRLQDLADISRILAIRVDIDRKYVEKSLRLLAKQLEAPEIWERVRSDPNWSV